VSNPDVPGLPVHVSVSEDVAWRKIDGLIVMLVLAGEQRYYRLDETGTRMWELLEESPDVAAAYAQLLDEYEVGRGGGRGGGESWGATVAPQLSASPRRRRRPIESMAAPGGGFVTTRCHRSRVGAQWLHSGLSPGASALACIRACACSGVRLRRGGTS
jgi:hypothetical protein